MSLKEKKKKSPKTVLYTFLSFDNKKPWLIALFFLLSLFRCSESNSVLEYTNLMNLRSPRICFLIFPDPNFPFLLGIEPKLAVFCCSCHKQPLILLGRRFCINYEPKLFQRQGSKVVKAQEVMGYNKQQKESGSFRQKDDSGEKWCLSPNNWKVALEKTGMTFSGLHKKWSPNQGVHITRRGLGLHTTKNQQTQPTGGGVSTPARRILNSI